MKWVCHASVLAMLLAAIENVVPHSCAATTVTWAAAVNGNFNDATKWTGGVTPGTNDGDWFNVALTFSTPYSVTFPGNTILQPIASYQGNSLSIRANQVTFLQSPQLNRGPATYTLASLISLSSNGTQGSTSSLSSSLSLLSSPLVTIGASSNGICTLNLNGGTLSSGALEIGEEERGNLNLNAGTTVNNSGGATLGYFDKATGSAGVNNATWNNTSDLSTSPLIVGRDGAGLIYISNGGKVNNGYCLIGDGNGTAGVFSSVTVTGAGSVWTNRKDLTVGTYNSSSLHILSGGQVTCDSAQVGPRVANLNATVDLSDGSSFTQNLDLTIGGTMSFTSASGSGNMAISSGSILTTGRNAFVGSLGTGTVSITDTASKWAIIGSLNVANSGTMTAADHSALSVGDQLRVGDDASGSTNVATISINSASSASTRVTIVAPTAAAHGQVNIDGAGSTWNATDQLYVGFQGNGLFQVTGGAKVTSGQTELGTSDGASGRILVDGAGSSLSASVSMNVGAVGTGTLTVAHGGQANVTGPFTIGSKGTVEGNSGIAASVRNGGVVAPGIASGPNASDAFGTLPFTGNYTQTANGTLRIDLHTLAEHDQLAVQGTAALAGTLQVIQASGFAPNPGDRFTILSSTGRTGTFETPIIQTNPSFYLTLSYTPTKVDLLSSAVGEKTWGVDANGNSSVSANWIGGVPGAVDDNVAFSTAISADRTVIVDTSFIAGTIYFDGAKPFTIAGPGGITLAVSGSNSASLMVKNLHGAGSHIISAPLTLANKTTFDIAPSGTLRITQQINSPGVAITKVGAGTLVLKNVRADSLAADNGTIQMISGDGAAGTSLIKSLTISAPAHVDLTNNDLLIDYTGASPYMIIRGYLLSGLGDGKSGIISSASQKAGNTIHAIVDNSALHMTSWNGMQIDDTTIIAKYTLRGDASLDGSVGFPDLVAVAQHYGDSSGHSVWSDGDFNYDGNVDFADLVTVAQNYGGALPAASIPGVSDGFNHDMDAAFASVPEPAWLSLALAGFALMGRKRQR